VGEHPGEGYLLPVDSHPAINVWSDDGTQMRPRINSYDSPFTIKPVRKVQLHNPATGVLSTIPKRPGVRVFNDSNSYWVGSHPSDAPADGRYQAEWNSVIIPNTGFDFRIMKLTARKVVLRINL
jgi:immune inhibitor A